MATLIRQVKVEKDSISPRISPYLPLSPRQVEVEKDSISPRISPYLPISPRQVKVEKDSISPRISPHLPTSPRQVKVEKDSISPRISPYLPTSPRQVKVEKDSIGGAVACVCTGVPAALGEPVFDRLEAKMAHAMMSLPATKGFEIGSGFGGTVMRGSTHNDPFVANQVGGRPGDSGRPSTAPRTELNPHWIRDSGGMVLGGPRSASRPTTPAVRSEASRRERPSTSRSPSSRCPPSDRRELGEMWRDVGRCGEMWGDRRQVGVNHRTGASHLGSSRLLSATLGSSANVRAIGRAPLSPSHFLPSLHLVSARSPRSPPPALRPISPHLPRPISARSLSAQSPPDLPAAQAQQTSRLTGEAITLEAKGRHDPCGGP